MNIQEKTEELWIQQQPKKKRPFAGAQKKITIRNENIPEHN